MTLWLLQPKERDAGPWVPIYDKMLGMVVRADSEGEAREIASRGPTGDEVRDNDGACPWLDDSLTLCDEIDGDGPSEVVLHDFNAG